MLNICHLESIFFSKSLSSKITTKTTTTQWLLAANLKLDVGVPKKQEKKEPAVEWLPGVKCNELKRKLSATLEGAAGKEARFLSVMVGAYQLMSRTFAAHQI